MQMRMAFFVLSFLKKTISLEEESRDDDSIEG